VASDLPTPGDPTDFLGRGWAYPVGVGWDDEVALADGRADIEQAIRIILATEPGERVMRPDFGAGLRRLLFEPINTATLSLAEHQVRHALVTWEPRIDVRDVTVTAADAASGRLLISIGYTIRATNTFYNLVYPFALQEGR
jgi:phage baseplate assembly protein W